MKKVISVLLVLVLLVSGLFMFTGCGNDDKKDDKDSKKSQSLSAAAGTYEGLYTKFVGDPDSAKNEDEEFTLVLKEDGTGKHSRDDLDLKVTWSLDGEKFKMTETFLGATIDYTGTLKDGKLDIFNGDPDDEWSCEYVYEKK